MNFYRKEVTLKIQFPEIFLDDDYPLSCLVRIIALFQKKPKTFASSNTNLSDVLYIQNFWENFTSYLTRY